VTPTDIQCVNAPTFARSTGIASHPPPEYGAGKYLKRRYIHDSRHETFRVSAPCLATRNGTASISGYHAVIAAHHETAARGNDVLKRVATVGTEFEHATIKADVRIDVRCFQIEVVPE